MKKIIIAIFLLCTSIFATEYNMGKKKINLDTINVESYLYININDLGKLGLQQRVEDGIATILDKEFVLNLSENKVKINNTTYTLSNNAIFVKNNKAYVDFPLIAELLNYDLKGQTLAKANEYTFPLKEEKYSVSKVPNRIVSLAPGVTEKIYDLNAFEKLVARTNFCEYPAKVKELPSIGTMYGPSIEKIIELKPDLVIAETHFNEKVLNKLKEAGIEVFAFSASNNFDDMYRFIKKLGFITGQIYESRVLVATLKNKVNRTKYVLKDVKTKTKLYYAIGAGNGDYTAGRDTFIAELIKTCGAINVGDLVKGWTFSLEKLIDSKPDYIFGADYTLDIMTKSKAYGGLTAIRNKKYFSVDENIFNLSGPRLITDGIKILVGKIYPTKLKELGF